MWHTLNYVIGVIIVYYFFVCVVCVVCFYILNVIYIFYNRDICLASLLTALVSFDAFLCNRVNANKNKEVWTELTFRPILTMYIHPSQTWDAFQQISSSSYNSHKKWWAAEQTLLHWSQVCRMLVIEFNILSAC